MPRKRATRAQGTRAKPKLNSLGDDIVNGMTPAERKAKLESFMKDFDLKVEEMRQKLENDKKGIIDYIEKTYYQTRLSFSVRERNMKLKDYIAEMQSVEEEGPSAVPVALPKAQTVQDTLSKYKSMRKIEPILEEDGAQTTVKKSRKGVKSKLAGVTFDAEPTPLSNRFVTPATSRNASALGWNTPLVTPKFDPRLPVTPAQRREARPGEVVMSLAGSPVNVHSEKSSRTRTIQIAIPEDTEYIDNIEIPDECSAENLKQVMNMLSDIMKKKQKEENSH